RRYRIPSDVAMGIRCHHGDSVLRFFHNKAVEEANSDGSPAPNIDDFRHLGTKPPTAETAIVMLADAVEASSRATFSHTDASPSAIASLVDRIVEEKVADDQLSDSPLTLSQLKAVKRAFVEALSGHYHQRIAYPNFPTTKSPR